MDKIRKTGIMEKVSKSWICQNLSKYQDRIVNLSTLNVFERRIVSPSPFFYSPNSFFMAANNFSGSKGLVMAG